MNIIRISIFGLLNGIAIATLYAQSIPPLVNYQGRLAKEDGTPFPTADYELRVTLYDAATGGNLVWGPQVFDGDIGAGHGGRVPIVQGYFNVVLGPEDTNGVSLASAFERANRFVEIAVNRRPAILPRQQITSAPFAIVSENGSPAGAVTAFAGSTNSVPAGWLLCDGASVTSNQYPRLFKAIGRAWGVGNGDEAAFSLPDLRGVFLRGADGGRSLDPDRESRGVSGPGGNSGNAVGSFQGDELRRHQHDWAGVGIGPVTYSRFAGLAVLSSGQTVGDPSLMERKGNALANNDNEGSIRPTGGGESRPKNVYVNYIIKY